MESSTTATTKTTSATETSLDDISALSSIRYKRLIEMIDRTLNKSRSEINIERAIQQCYGNDDDTTMNYDMTATYDNADNNNNDDTTKSLSSNQVFQTILSSSLDKVNRNVMMGINQYLQEQNVADKLHRFECIVQELELEAERRKMDYMQDKESTVQAIKKSKLSSSLLLLDERMNDENATAASANTAATDTPGATGSSTTNNDSYGTAEDDVILSKTKQRLYDIVNHQQYDKLVQKRDQLQDYVTEMERKIKTMEEYYDNLTKETQEQFNSIQSNHQSVFEQTADLCSRIS